MERGRIDVHHDDACLLGEHRCTPETTKGPAPGVWRALAHQTPGMGVGRVSVRAWLGSDVRLVEVLNEGAAGSAARLRHV